MELYEAIGRRVTVHSFKPDPIPEGTVRKILEAGILAPSAFNSQPWEFIFIRSSDIRDELVRMREKIPQQKEALGSAPLILAVAYDTKLGNEAVASAFTCIENMLLTAAAEGLGAVTLSFHGDRIKRLLGLPEGYDVAAIIPMGIPAATPERPPRIPVERKIHTDRW